ncbi:hypothetical protein ABZX75_11085 [Streptomyces sp. NPDC003038]|uniref:hypothetical protein n=1 Tax=unclassified Streptomyces TaxID=2593676 RepID=UPI0033BA0EDB
MTVGNTESSARPTCESLGDERDEGRGPAAEEDGGELFSDQLSRVIRGLLAAR